MSIPFGEIGPVSFWLGFVELSIEVDDELSEKLLAKLTGLQLFMSVASFELKVFLLADVPAYLSRHVD